MPNWCHVEAEIQFENKEELQTAFTFMKLDWAEAPDRHPHRMGMTDNWLFNKHIPEEAGESGLMPATGMFYINGDVRWYLAENQVKGMIKWFLEKGAKHNMVFWYEECGNDLAGKYVYDQNGLYEYILPETHEYWNWGNDEDEDVPDRKYECIKDIPETSFELNKIPINIPL